MNATLNAKANQPFHQSLLRSVFPPINLANLSGKVDTFFFVWNFFFFLLNIWVKSMKIREFNDAINQVVIQAAYLPRFKMAVEVLNCS